jgi:hypothetical protein
MSEADLLVWYSEHARPRQDPGCGGFFLEELPGRFPRTRLFYLPYKWAYEFIMRKDDRSVWEKELPMEYTFFTPHEFRKELSALGARVMYSGQHWDEDYIEDNFDGRFRLYKPDGTPLGHPATSFIAVAVKMAERKSLYIEERRPSGTAETSLKIAAVRNQKTGQILDVVTRDLETSEIIPYRIDEEGRLKIYLHDGIARSIANAVPRSGTNIDSKVWSGHMVEAISVDAEAMQTMEELDVKHTVRFARDYLGLKPKDNAVLKKGPDYYPAPDYIDERVFTYYLSVEESKGQIVPKPHVGQSTRFQARGVIQEMDAQQILNAITVGLIPNARLEMQILTLFNHLEIEAETWTDKHVAMQAGEISQKTSLKDMLKILHMDEKRFKDVKGTAGQLRPVHSIFVEEGQTKGSISGLSSQDMDFVVRNDQTINTAIVLPLTKDIKGDVHAGFIIDHLPVPQRHEGKAAMISAPSFNLPPDITNIQQAKKYVADRFSVMPSMVVRMGESYFTHIGMTPHRIYPFAVAVPPGKPANPNIKFLPYYQFKLLRRSISTNPHFMTLIARGYRYFNQQLKLDLSTRVASIVQQRFDHMKPEWSLPLGYKLAPSTARPKKYKEPAALPEIQQAPQNLPQNSANITDGQNSKSKDDDSDSSGAAEANEPNIDALTIDTNRAGVKVPSLRRLFEQELEEFIETLEEENAPRPEKW